MPPEKPSPPTVTQPNPPHRVLVFGCGYLGERVALQALDDGAEVFATTRDPAKARRLARAGLTPLLADWADRRSLAGLPAVNAVLVAVSFDRRSRQPRYDSLVGGLMHLINSLGPEVAVCYISTTGVYHQSDGGWVDETSTTRPGRDSGRAHLAAEGVLWRRRPNSPWTILRLAGIYGPGRIPRAADVIAERPIPARPEGYLNLIHVEDAARAVRAAWQQPRERLYLVADDQPVRRGDFYREIARQCGAAEPSFTEPATGSAAQLRADSNKRIWNRRLKRDLLPQLKYPTYREGLAAIDFRAHRNG